jgi:prepilin-type processing-associated H-X9-DG protein
VQPAAPPPVTPATAVPPVVPGQAARLQLAVAAPAGPATSSHLATAALLIGVVVLVLLIGSTIWRILRFAQAGEFALGALDVVEGLVRFAGCVTGLVLGIVATVKIRKSRGRLKGTGKAITGICLCAGAFILSGVAGALAVALPAIAQVKDKRAAVGAQANVKNLYEAAMTHASDHDSRLPDADTFPKALAPYAGEDMDQLLSDPADRGAGRAFAMNARLSGVYISAVRTPHNTVLFFECEFGSPCAGTREHLPARPRHRDGYIICFADGHVEQVPPDEVDDLVWDPRGR